MKLTVARAIVRFLEQAGVEIATGCNGHGNWGLLDTVEHESRIRGIKTTAKDASVHMADCYWRMRRPPPMPIRWDQKPVSSPEEWARNLVPDGG